MSKNWRERLAGLVDSYRAGSPDLSQQLDTLAAEIEAAVAVAEAAQTLASPVTLAEALAAYRRLKERA